MFKYMKNVLKNKYKLGIMSLMGLVPAVTFAQTRTLADLIGIIIGYLGLAIPLILSLSIVVFIYGVYKYFIKIDAEKKEAGNFILYGVLGFFLMLSFWGLVNILINTFRLDTRIPGIPFIRTTGGNNDSVFIQNPRSNDSVFIQNPRSNEGDFEANYEMDFEGSFVE